MASVDRAHVIFNGRVQGVGFRYTTHRLARQFPGITGFVRNLPDGTVEVLAEGTKDEVSSLLAQINEYMSEHISAVNMSWDSGSRNSDSFAIHV
jgi:acylphosphatase